MPQSHLFEPERAQPAGAGRDYENEMRVLEAQADALRAEADRIDLKQAHRECASNVARATKAAASCANSNAEHARTKIQQQQERFKSLAVAQGVDLEEEIETSTRASHLEHGRYGATATGGSATTGATEDRLAALRARACARAAS